MSVLKALRTFSHVFSWKPTGKPQRTLATPVELSGVGLHSGVVSTVRLLPATAGEGRFFVFPNGESVPAAVDYVVDSRLSTELRSPFGGARVRTVEHLLSALEALAVDNCRIEMHGGDEVPLLDGSAREWLEALVSAGFCDAKDSHGQSIEKMAPVLLEPSFVQKDDSFVAAFPFPRIRITYGIDFQKATAIGQQWFSSILDSDEYTHKISAARTFCIYEEVEKMRSMGLIRGGSEENAIVCSIENGWMNPPLRFCDEPCRHKILDLVGDFSLLAKSGHQGLPVAHIVAYKAGHALHVEFIRHLLGV